MVTLVQPGRAPIDLATGQPVLVLHVCNKDRCLNPQIIVWGLMMWGFRQRSLLHTCSTCIGWPVARSMGVPGVGDARGDYGRQAAAFQPGLDRCRHCVVAA